MKRFLSLLVFSIIFCCQLWAQPNKAQEPEKPQTGIVFKEMAFNFNEKDYNSDVSHSFFFTNNSNSPIAIKDIKPSCACTTTDYTKTPIMPGKSGYVSIKYDSSREGHFVKSVTVVISDETFVLTFLGTIKKAPHDSNVMPKN